MSAKWIAVAALAAVGLYLIVIFNRLVRQRNLVREGWSGIDVQLRRRSDLVPNLVETVKSYAAHERSVLEELTATRTTGVASNDVQGQAAAARAMQAALGRLFALAQSRRFPTRSSRIFSVFSPRRFSRSKIRRRALRRRWHFRGRPHENVATYCACGAVRMDGGDAGAGEGTHFAVRQRCAGPA